VSQLTKKYHYSAKKLLTASKLVWYPESIEATKWFLDMINNLRMYIIYCATIAMMTAFRILNVTRVSICKTLRGFASTIVFSNNTNNPGILASSLCSSVLTLLQYSGRLDVNRFFVFQSSLISAQDIFIANFHKLRIIYNCILNDLNRRKCQDDCKLDVK
jgi:hypothetical protein